MTTFEQGNRQFNGQGNSQSGTGSSKQGSDQHDPNFVLVDAEQDLEIGDEGFILGEVRRVDRAGGNRQSSQGDAGGGRQGEQGDSRQQAPDTTGSTGV